MPALLEADAYTALTGETFPLFKNTGKGFRDLTYPSGAGALTRATSTRR